MDKTQVWNQVLQNLAQKISRMEFHTWFKKVHLKEISGDAVLISCPTEMNKNWLESKYRGMLLANIQKTLPEIGRLYFEVDLSLADKPPANLSAFEKPKAPRKLPNKPIEKLHTGHESRLVQEKYTLDNFVVGETTQLAHAACLAVAGTADKEAKKYNPLYLYGDVGLGKTHLLQGTANAIRKINPDAVVIYTTAERFTNEAVRAMRERKTEELRKKYRRVDFLLIDDVQFFAGKEKTQVEVFNTFNDLRDLNKQMIFSADCPPAQLPSLMDRLSSRFGWGLVVDLSMPNFETKLEIIQAKSQRMGLLLPEDVQEFIATNIRKNLRELENVLNKISAELEITQVSPTIQSVGKMFRKLNPQEDLVSNRSHTSLARSTDDIVTLISDYFQIPATDLLGTSRKQEIVFPRQISWLLCKDVLKMSFEGIGEAFGGKNHTTIMHGVRKVKELARTDSATARHIHALKKDLGA